jgi:hypothetical protein
MANRLAKNFNCPTEFTPQVLGGKRKTVTLCYLSLGPLRYPVGHPLAGDRDGGALDYPDASVISDPHFMQRPH